VLDISDNVGTVSLDLILDVFFEFLSDLNILLYRIFSVLDSFILTTSHIVKGTHHHIFFLVCKGTHVLDLKLEASQVLGKLINHLLLELKDQVISIGLGYI
jgi:hypothetical protein